jgi:hypothetical protein
MLVQADMTAACTDEQIATLNRAAASFTTAVAASGEAKPYVFVAADAAPESVAVQLLDALWAAYGTRAPDDAGFAVQRLIDESIWPHMRDAMSKIALESTAPSFGTLLVRGIGAGWLIALMVWLLPFAEAARIWVIIILAYLVGLAGFPHVIAGNVETFYLVSLGAVSLSKCFAGYLVPALIGNIIGGVALVAVGAHAEFFEADEEKK